MTLDSGGEFEVSGWQSTGGVTLGLRFGAANARAFVDPTWKGIVVELDGEPYPFQIRASFWRHCPEIRGPVITAWLRRHQLAPWPRGAPPRFRMLHIGGNRFRALTRPACSTWQAS